MIVHIAIYRWIDGVSAEEVAASLQQVRALRAKVPGVVDIRCGTNFSRWNEGYTHAIVVLAESAPALDAYRNHPDHTTVAARIEAIEAAGIGIDFEDSHRGAPVA